MKNYFHLSLFVFLFVFIPFMPRTILAIGQMTEPIVLENALRGQEVRDTISVTNSENKEISVKLTAEGQISGWAVFYATEDEGLANPIDELVLPVRGSAQAIVILKIPTDIPNGDYVGSIGATSKPTEKTQSSLNDASVTISQKISRPVTIKVTDTEIVKLEPMVFPMEYSVAVGQPLKIKAVYDNQGNVSVKPDIQFKITNADATTVLHNAIYPYPDNEGAVKSLEIKQLPEIIEWQTAGQAVGRYQAYAKIMLDDTVIKEENFQFDILPAGLANSLSADPSNSIGGNYNLILSIAGVGLLLVAGLILAKKKFGKKETITTT